MTPMVWKVLGTAAAVAAGAAACALVDRGLRRMEHKIEADRAAAADTAQPAQDAGAESAAAPEAPAAEAPATAGEAPAAPAPQEASPAPAAPDLGESLAEAELRSLMEQLKAEGAQESGPNPNPVMAPPAQAPHTSEGKVDAEKLCAAEDFCNWEDLGCQG